jgi:D-alanyl-D-alanine carboxypeptidase
MPAHNASAQTTHHHKHKHKSRHAHQNVHALIMRVQPASLVMDADTHEILESEAPDSIRYPASLTKMMTLYLTFDALKKGTLHLNQPIPVSEHAAGMPQTNIALHPGDTIPVKDAILSIVVRSANDSAVTLAEAVGGSELGFAGMMNKKAHELGMKNTYFHNASGLPDPLQRTTARDMVTLGLALRNNFPEYFPLFKTESFTYNGITYPTHNHVMMRYEGVDGIKTGYIRASGFNLVTSATHDGHHIIAAVMGGATWKSRDDKMIALLDNAFTRMADLPGSNRVHLAASIEQHEIERTPSKSAAGEKFVGEGDIQMEKPAPKADVSLSPKQMRMPSTMQAQTLASTKPAEGWGVQVGVFTRADDAAKAASHAMEVASAELGTAAVSVTGEDDNQESLHRARLVNLTQDQAKKACQKLSDNNDPCFVYRMN